MKGTSLIVSIVLFVAVAVLYVLHFTGGSKTSTMQSRMKKQLLAETD